MKPLLVNGRLPHVLQIVIKNTSELDYSAPILWKLASDRLAANVTVLYTAPSRRQYLRDSTFYPSLFARAGIRETDFADFPKRPLAPPRSVVERLFAASPSDRPSLTGSIVGLRSGRNTAKHARDLVHATVGAARQRLQAVGMRALDVEGVLPALRPDLVFLGNRSETRFHKRESFYAYYERAQKPIVLLPHGTHEVHPFKEFIPFDERGAELAPYCDFWSALQFETPELNCPGREGQFARVTYPGLDSEWMEYVGSDGAPRSALPPRVAGVPRCLLILRKFLPKGYPRPEGFDPFTLDYGDMLGHLDSIGDALSVIGDVDVVIKPHPSNNFPMLAEILGRSRLRRWTISSEPMYPLLPETDFAIAIFSTSMLLPAMYGRPVIVLHSKLQEYVHDRWPLLAEIYTGLRHYVRDAGELAPTVRRVRDELRAAPPSRAPRPSPDVTHLRRFYPDGGVTAAVERMRFLLERQAGL